MKRYRYALITIMILLIFDLCSCTGSQSSLETLDNVKVITGLIHTLALRNDGTVWSWGLVNEYGQFGTGEMKLMPFSRISDSFMDSSVPLPESCYKAGQVLGPQGKGFLTNVIEVDASGGTSIALRKDGTVWTWGESVFWHNNPDHSSVPVQVVELDNVIKISAALECFVALKNNGTVWVWGFGEGIVPVKDSQGNYIPSKKPIQIQGLTDVINISAGSSEVLALRKDGTVWAWGDVTGILPADDPSSYDRILKETPIQVQGLRNVIAINAEFRGYAIQSDGTVWGWGLGLDDLSEQLSDKRPYHSPPVRLKNITNIKSICDSMVETFILKNDGTAWRLQWRDNPDLSRATRKRSSPPEQILEFKDDVVAITGSNPVFALKKDGTVWQLTQKKLKPRIVELTQIQMQK